MGNLKLKRIGYGWQYTVYDKGKRVIKIPNSRGTIFKIIIKHNLKLVLNPKKFKKIIDNLIKNRNDSLKKLKSKKINLKILGNPIIKGEEIEQDKVIVLKEKLVKSKNPKKYLDKFIKLIFECWKHGFSEKVYNLTINNGVYVNGNVILLDFGEITWNKEKAKKQIKKKKWETS